MKRMENEEVQNRVRASEETNSKGAWVSSLGIFRG